MQFDLKITTESLATILAGFVALVIYWLHRKDEKKKAAIVLLSEIREAERAISEIKKTGIVTDYSKVITENHWKEYQYLFARSLDSDDIDLVNNFYTSCEVVEEQLKLVKSYLPISMETKVRLTQEKLLGLAENSENKNELELKKKKILDTLFWPNEDWFEPGAPKTKLVTYINAIVLVIPSNAGNKLKQIANSSWWKIFI